MSASQKTVKLDSGLFEDARGKASLLSRSVSGQIEHWARIGRAIEASLDFSYARVCAVLEGRATVESLSDGERATFFDQLGDALANPTQRERDFYAALGCEPGATGRDEHGTLVQTISDGDTAAA